MHGLLYSEGIIADRPISCSRCAGSGLDGVISYNVLDVTCAADHRASIGPLQRADDQRVRYLHPSIDQVLRESPYAADPEVRVAAGLVLSAPMRLRRHQKAFDSTGGLHAAGCLG